ncbi:MAG: antitoxin [Chloroflexi bacterium]|nr:MAG: antitoxin [Chloroflexota bacterium]RLC76390.1 MAG: antitoxin [Chloroflexota bacterium]
MTHDRIDINPVIMFGKPVIKTTRITVEHILRKLAGGMLIDEILDDHPHLTLDDVYAAAKTLKVFRNLQGLIRSSRPSVF